MKAFRALLYIIILILCIVFVLQNAWLNEEHSVVYRLFTLTVGETAPFPIWGLVLGAFFGGYLLGWSVGRLDIISLKGNLRKTKRRLDQLDAAQAAPAATPPAK